MIEPQSVLDFWFGAPDSAEFGTQRKLWFAKDAAFDSAIADRFGASVERALRGELDDWATTGPGALARILLLDQFTRNAFRGEKRAFAGDAQALAAASAMVGSRGDELLPPFMRVFVCERTAPPSVVATNTSDSGIVTAGSVLKKICL